MKVKLIHKDWDDYVILDLNNNKLKRLNLEDEDGNFLLNKNILNINWPKWGDEIFISYKSDNIYYLCEEINFNHVEWEDTCYIDYVNKIVTKKKDGCKGYLEESENNELIILWEDNSENQILEESQNKILEVSQNQILEVSQNQILEVSQNKILEVPQNKILEESQNKILEVPQNKILEVIQNKIEIPQNNIKIKKIPNIIHFIYGFKPQTEEFELYRYIAIKSAHDVNKPDKIYFYYHYEPFGEWWEKIKPFITLEKINLPDNIFGKKLYHYAHQADIIRIQKLIEHGGIYLDIDTICLKSFEDLLHHDFVMGCQSNSDDTEIYGLCNAIILSKPDSFFANKWLESYETFRSKGRDKYWDEHSVLKPLELSKLYKNNITVLNGNTFFYPLWYKISDVLFNEQYDIEEYKKIIENNYCIHLWDTYSNKYLKTIDEEYLFSTNTLFNIFARKFLKNKISILILTYNRNEITERCLESYFKCLDLDYIEELIILDNNSDISLIRYLTNFQSKHEKIKLILSDDNLGVCGGRTILFNEAIGDIIISIDSDAYLINNSFFERIQNLLYDERYGIVGISGAYIKSWDFGKQHDISDDDENEYIVDHIAGCCQAFRRDLFHFGFQLDPYYGKFWVEDTDLSMQSLQIKKINYRINQKNYIEHHWGGSGKNFKELFLINWTYFSNKWKGKVLHHLT